MEEPARRPDLVHLRGPRGGAGRDRLRGPERDRALPPAARALDEAPRRALQPGRRHREPGARHHERQGRQPVPGHRRARALEALRGPKQGAVRPHERVPPGRARERRAALPADPRRAARPAEHHALDDRLRGRRERPADRPVAGGHWPGHFLGLRRQRHRPLHHRPRDTRRAGRLLRPRDEHDRRAARLRLVPRVREAVELRAALDVHVRQRARGPTSSPSPARPST